MLSSVQMLVKQALETFTCKKEVFNSNMEALKSLVNKITVDDVKLSPTLLNRSTWEKPTKAPATYVDIFQDDNVTVGIFVLKPGMLLPLHNHPDMHGLIKVIFGKIRVTSYTIDLEKSRKLESPTSLLNKYLVVKKESEIFADSLNDCCVLYPEYKNLHEIESVEGPAAFMDILSPPYETLNENGEIRHCNYYKILSEIGPNIFKIEKSKSAPAEFWTDSCPFMGNISI